MILKVIRLKKNDNRKFNIFVLNSIKYYSHLSIVVCYLGKKNPSMKKKRRNKNKPVPHTIYHQLFGPFISGFLDRITNFSLEYILYNICRLLQCLYRILEKKKKVTWVTLSYFRYEISQPFSISNSKLYEKKILLSAYVSLSVIYYIIKGKIR